MPLSLRAPLPPRRRPRAGRVLALLAAALTLAVAGPLAGPRGVAAKGPDRAPKLAPTRVVRYVPGHRFTPDTDIRSASGYAAWRINAFLVAETPLPPIGEAFVRAERETGVNALYLLAHAMLESGYGTSAIAQVKHNLFGYHAYDRDPGRYASRYASFKTSVREVARRIHDDYLTPGGRFWGGYTTLRAMNLCYASDPGWADKIAVIANRIEGATSSLRERGIRFGSVGFAAAPVAGAAATLTVRWRGHPGATLPAAIGFAVRWSPVAVAETAAVGPRLRLPAWSTVRWVQRRPGALGLRLGLPTTPGLWRLEVRALDAGGDPLPALDAPAIAGLTVRVLAKTEGTLHLGLATDGRLVATLRVAGGRPIAALARSGARTALEVWALPLDATRPALRLAASGLGADLRAGQHLEVTLGAATVRALARRGPAVVVARLIGDAAAIGRSVPAVVLLAQGRLGPAATPLRVADPRTTDALARAAGRAAAAAAPRPLALAAGPEPGQVVVRLDAAVVAAAADFLPGAPVAAGQSGPEVATLDPGDPATAISPAAGIDVAAGIDAAVDQPDASAAGASAGAGVGGAPVGEPVGAGIGAGGPASATGASAGTATAGATAGGDTAADPAPAGDGTAAPAGDGPATPAHDLTASLAGDGTVAATRSSDAQATAALTVPARAATTNAATPTRSPAATSGISKPAVGRPRVVAATGGRAMDATGPAAAGAVGTPATPTARSPHEPEQATILVRTLGTGLRPAAPDLRRLTLDGDALAAASIRNGVFGLPVTGLGGGLRLVLAALVEPGATIADASTLVLAWLPVELSVTPAPASPGDVETR